MILFLPSKNQGGDRPRQGVETLMCIGERACGTPTNTSNKHANTTASVRSPYMATLTPAFV
jgi:hypothetical protein